MKEEIITTLIKTGILRKRQKDTKKIKSLVESAEINAKVAKNVKLTEESATLIFREIYESIRQLGEAEWLTKGYEPQNHDITLESLKEMDIKNKIKLNHLDRFKKIRHDINYQGFRASISQAEEMIEFWDSCSKDILKTIMNGLKK